MDANTPKPHPPRAPFLAYDKKMPDSLAQFVDEIMEEVRAKPKPAFVPKPHLTQRPFLMLATVRNSMNRK